MWGGSTIEVRARAVSRAAAGPLTGRDHDRGVHPREPQRSHRQDTNGRRQVPARQGRRARCGRGRGRAPAHREQPRRLPRGHATAAPYTSRAYGPCARDTPRAARACRRPTARAQASARRSDRTGTRCRTDCHRATRRTNRRIARRNRGGNAYQTGSKAASIGSSLHMTNDARRRTPDADRLGTMGDPPITERRCDVSVNGPSVNRQQRMSSSRLPRLQSPQESATCASLPH